MTNNLGRGTMQNVTQEHSPTILQRLAGCLNQLNDAERLILALHYLEHLSLQEIATVTESSETSVRQLHNRALSKLRGRMEFPRFECPMPA